MDEIYGGIFRTYIILLFISCARLFYFVDRFFFSIISWARLFYFVDRFFLFYYLVRTTFLFRRSFFLFYYLVRTTFFYLVCRFFLFYYLVRTTFFYACRLFFFSTVSWERLIDLFSGEKLYSHQTADQPPTNADQFLWLGRVWSGKKLPALIEKRIYPRSTTVVSALYPWCTHAQIPLFPTYPLLSADQFPLFTTNPDLFLIQLRSLRSI